MMVQKTDYKKVILFFALAYFFCSYAYQNLTYLVKSDFKDFGLNYYNADALRRNDFLQMGHEELKSFLKEPTRYDSALLHGRGDLPVARAASVYPPIVYLLLRPLTWLPYRMATVFWFVLNHLFLMGSLLLIFRALAKEIPFEGKSLLLILTFSFFPIQFNVMLGQINLVTLFFLLTFCIIETSG